MAPRALLLSADVKITAVLREALTAAKCKVDRCKDIFSAAEAITRDKFDILLIDWHEALEANFLLNTARELRSNEAAFVVGLVTPAQGRDALENGADAVLVKPFTPAQAAEMLLAKLGSESAAPVDLSPASQAKTDRPAADAATPVPPIVTAPVPIIAKDDLREARPQVERKSLKNQAMASEPSPRVQSRRSHMLSFTALVWPLIIVAALLAFDHWPSISRVARVASSQLKASPAQSSVQLPIPPAAAVPMTDDLLSDYAAPAASVPAMAQEQNLVQRKPDDIDLVSVEALPSTRRLLAPVFNLEPSRPKLEVPASLRFPTPPQNAVAIAPAGHLVAPDWSEGPISLPETVSRTLLEHQVMPRYPEQALPTGADSPVVLQAWIGKDGAVRELKLVSGSLLLAHAAVEAVKQWRYRPYRRNGENVEIETLITVNFKRPPRG
jgi:protein TonB